MELKPESRQHIEHVAGEALTQLDSIATAAKSKLHDGRTLSSDALASINTMTSRSAIQNLDQISQANRESYQVLAAEPAIARVVVVDDEDCVSWVAGAVAAGGSVVTVVLLVVVDAMSRCVP